MDNFHSTFEKIINHKAIIRPDRFMQYKEEAQRQLNEYLFDRISKYGYIVKSSVKILGYSFLTFQQQNLNGNGLVYVKFKCRVINILNGKVYKCEVVDNNTKSILCQPVFDEDKKIRPINIFVQEFQQKGLTKEFSKIKQGEHIFVKVIDHNENTIHGVYQAFGNIIDEKSSEVKEAFKKDNSAKNYETPINFVPVSSEADTLSDIPDDESEDENDDETEEELETDLESDKEEEEEEDDEEDFEDLLDDIDEEEEEEEEDAD